MNISNFLRFSDFFIELYKKYPQIEFIFRPHPLLYVTLRKADFWGEEKTKQYFEYIQTLPNVVYQDGGEYFETFVNSDGIIHDCASFLCEYLYTDHPVCYMLKNKEAIVENFDDLGKAALEYCYQAFNESDIIDFIENVILKKNDPKKEKRLQFANEYIKINYPNATDAILKDLKTSLGIFK